MNNSGKGKDEEEGRAGKEGRESKETGECSRGKEVERERESGQTALDKNNCCTPRQDSNSREHSVNPVPGASSLRPLLSQRQVALTSGSNEDRTEKQ